MSFRETKMPTMTDVFAKARENERMQQLATVRELDALPYFRVLEGPTLPVVEMEGARRIMLGSNNYLGLTGDERVRKGALDALQRYGTGITGSRFLNGTLDLHIVLERELADWLGTESALVFTTGHQANLGTLGTILGPADTAVVDSGDHASILDGCILSRAKLRAFRHNRLDRLERTLEKAHGCPRRGSLRLRLGGRAELVRPAPVRGSCTPARRGAAARAAHLGHASDARPATADVLGQVAGRADPDLVVNTGDSIPHPDAVRPFLDALGPLLDRPGVFVSGSNDLYSPEPKNPSRYLWRDESRRILSTSPTCPGPSSATG